MNHNQLFMDAKTTQYGSHMVMTGSKKPTRTIYINIDTRFRDDTNSSTLASYNITLPDRILGVRSMEVVSAEIPYTMYNVSSNIGNNRFYISYTTNDINNVETVTIPDGNYTSQSTLLTQINTQISSLDSSYNTLSVYSENVTGTTYMCNMKNTAQSGSLQINFGNLAHSPHEKANLRGTIGWKLGFRDTNYVISSSSGVSGESFIDISAPKYVYISLDDYSRSVNNSFIAPFSRSVMNKNIIAKIPVSSSGFSFGDTIRANFINGTLVSDTRVFMGNSGVDLQKFKVELVDEFGTPVDMNEMDFSFTLRLELE
jgi:hypothetical protein